MARSTTSSTPTAISGTPAGRTGSRGASSTRRAGSTASTATTSSPRPRPTGTTRSTSRSRPRTSSRTCSSTATSTRSIFQSTYLYDWYTEGFNTADKNGGLKDLLPKYADRIIVNGRFDPREGDAGLKQLEEDAKKWNLKGVKVYTAEWYNDSRGWRLDIPEAYRFLEKCQELGIKNIHAHKGPTIWPLDKDAFNVVDIDAAATDHQDLNFIVEHAGIPRIEDFCFMAVQEPNVYAGLSVVLGGLMHARPKFFAKVMGELLFWVGEDKLTFGSDYNIWTPKWQIEGFVDWQMPDDEAFTDFGKLTTATKKKILGLNAAKLYDIEVPAEFAVDTTADETGAPGHELVDDTAGAGAQA